MMDPAIGKIVVKQAMQRLVDDKLAEWVRGADGRLTLRLATGESFALGELGVTCELPAMQAVDEKSEGHQWI